MAKTYQAKFIAKALADGINSLFVEEHADKEIRRMGALLLDILMSNSMAEEHGEPNRLSSAQECFFDDLAGEFEDYEMKACQRIKEKKQAAKAAAAEAEVAELKRKANLV